MKPIENVNSTNLFLLLSNLNFSIDEESLDIILDAVAFLREKDAGVIMTKDVYKLKENLNIKKVRRLVVGEFKTIDKVTIENLDIALRFFGIVCDKVNLDIIIDVVGLLENKGDFTTLKDISELQKERNKNK